MAAPIVYRWDDGNAPVARGERRSLCDILYACLVTGYGSKPGAGWTREFVNATFDKAVFRNNPLTGTGFFLQVDGAGTVNAYTSTVMAYESMTSLNDGLSSFGLTGTYTTSNAANATARPWVLIADDRAFYLYVWNSITGAPANSSNTAQGLFFGDGVRRDPSDNYFCMFSIGALANRGPIGSLYSPSTAVASGNLGFYAPRRSTGVYSPINLALIRGGGPGADVSAGANGIIYTAGDPILVARPHVSDGVAYSFRGHIPGLYYPCHPNAFGQLATVSAAGKSFLSLRVPINVTASNLFIDLADWRI
jgi:hypothetical protein